MRLIRGKGLKRFAALRVRGSAGFLLSGSERISAGGEFTRRAMEPACSAVRVVKAKRCSDLCYGFVFLTASASQQLRAIADLTRRYARSIADLTVRQNIQLHWITIESLPEVLEELWRVGLNTTGACGDVTRNITGCPVAGVDADEICDASALALEADRLLAGNAEFYNLPRKFKISISGCRVWCPYPEINDIGLTAIKRLQNGKEEIGFSLRVAGGLSTDPHLGVRLDAFVRWNQVLPTLHGIAELFRDSSELREHRERARLKFLFLREGWTAEDFQKEVERRIGFQFDPAVPEEPPSDVYRDHVGIHPQRQPGYSYVGAAVLRGRITPEQMRAAADLAERFAGGELRTTNMQNLLIVNVPHLQAEPLAKELTPSDCGSVVRLSTAAPSPAVAPNFASWRSLRRKVFRDGW